MGRWPTQGDEKTPPFQQPLSMKASPSPLSSRPKRTQSSYLAALDRATCAAFIKESRMKYTGAPKFNRKSGGAEWRDLRFSSLF
jgi:hypothetical protein